MYLPPYWFLCIVLVFIAVQAVDLATTESKQLSGRVLPPQSTVMSFKTLLSCWALTLDMNVKSRCFWKTRSVPGKSLHVQMNLPSPSEIRTPPNCRLCSTAGVFESLLPPHASLREGMTGACCCSRGAWRDPWILIAGDQIPSLSYRKTNALGRHSPRSTTLTVAEVFACWGSERDLDPWVRRDNVYNVAMSALWILSFLYQRQRQNVAALTFVL